MSKRSGEFVHLHVHSRYSPRDAYNNYSEILAYTRDIGQQAVAITDHYYMYNISEFYFESIKNDEDGNPLYGVKGIIGCELGLAPEGKSYDLLSDEKSYFHITALAMNEVGKKNLMKIASISTMRDDEHFYRYPRVVFDDFKKYNEGIILLSGCLGSELNSLLTYGKYNIAKEVAKKYKDVFGDRYYIEVQDHGIPQQIKNNKSLLKLCEELDIKPVLTNDVHYTEKDYAEAHGRLVYGAKGQLYEGLGEVDYYTTPDFYLKDSDEMWEIAMKYDCPQMYNSTVEIGERCEVVGFDTTEIKFPAAKLEKYDSADRELEHLIMQFITNKYPNPNQRVPVSAWDGQTDNISKIPDEMLSPQTPMERAKQELIDIAEAGYSDYFLIVYDMLKYAHENGIMVGPGRGSAGGSILANILDIVDICPLKYGLFFERFFNKGRVDSPPDIDIDFPPSRRDEVMTFLVNKYGEDRVCQITTFGEISGKSALHIACSSLYGDKKLSNSIGYAFPKKGGDLAYLIENHEPMIKEYKDKDKREVIDWALELTGCVNNTSTHAAGVVIGREPLTNFIPLYANQNASGWTSQFEYALLEKMRLLKMDLLGLETLDVIQNTLWNIEETQGKKISLKDIPENDEKTFRMLRAGDTKGVFQIEADWCTDIVKRANIHHFDHISALVALIRPGSLNSGMTESYLRRALGEEKAVSVHPKIDHITGETYHCFVYQEQVMKTAEVLAGFDLLKADKLRKTIAKSKREEILNFKDDFIKGAQEVSGMSKKDATEIFDAFEKFGAYGFNKAHSVGYAKNSYITAYLKANYFLEFMSALLTSVVGATDKTVTYINNVLEHGYKMMPPDINISTNEFVPDAKNNSIRFPISAIDGVGPSAVDAIVEERELGGPYKSFEDFVYRTPGKAVKKDTIASLIVVGAFDSMGYTRKDLYEDCDDIVARIRGQKKKVKAKGLGIGGKQEEVEKEISPSGDEYDSSELVEDELNYIGFAFSLTEEEEAKRLRKIKKNSKVNYDDADLYEGGSKSSSSSSKKSKISALKKLRSMRNESSEETVDEPMSKEDDEKARSIRGNIMSKISKSNIRKAYKDVSGKDMVESSDVQLDAEDEKVVLLSVNVDDNIFISKITKVSAKYKSDSGVKVVFEVTTTDESKYILETGLRVDNSKRFALLMNKIIGENNVRVVEPYWN